MRIGATSRRVAIGASLPVLVVASATACGLGEREGSTGPVSVAKDAEPTVAPLEVQAAPELPARTTRPRAAPPPANMGAVLTIHASCGRWSAASPAEREPLAEELASAPTMLRTTARKTLTLVTRSCRATSDDATIRAAIAAQLRLEQRQRDAAQARRLAASRISGPFARNISRRIRRSWNICGSADVCVAGTTARAVGCSQPDLLVQRLRCTVVTRRGERPEDDAGYIVRVDVFDTRPMVWWIVGPAS